MQPLDAADEAQPRLVRADVQHRRVDDGQHQQVAVDQRTRTPASTTSNIRHPGVGLELGLAQGYG